MWIANVISVNFKSGKLIVGVSYSKDGYFFNEEYSTVSGNVTDSWIKDIIESRLSSLDNMENVVSTIQTGQYTPRESVEQTQDELDKNSFLSKIRKLNKMLKLVEFGILESSNENITTLKQEINSLYSNDYIDLID